MGRKHKKGSTAGQAKGNKDGLELEKSTLSDGVKPKIKNDPEESVSKVDPVEENQPTPKQEVQIEPTQHVRRRPISSRDAESRAVLKKASKELNSQSSLSLKDLVMAITKASSDRKRTDGSSKPDNELKDELGSLLQHIKTDKKRQKSPHASDKPLTKEEGISEIMQLLKAKSESKLKSRSTDSSPSGTAESLLDSTSRAKLSILGNDETAKEDTGVCQFCELEATTKCTGCRKVFYCSRDCQKSHWSKHKDVCRPYKIGKAEGFGRVLVANRAISMGEEILREKPFIVGPRPCGDHVCLTCYKRISGSYRCSQCAWPMCNDSCANNEAHSVECSVSNRANLGGPEGLAARGYHGQHSEILTALRCLVAYRQDPIRWRTMVDKFGARHSLALSNGLQQLHNQQTIVEPLRNAFRIEQHPSLTSIQDTAIHTVLSVLQVHSLPTRSTYGEVSGLYPMASLLGHSCVPNTRTRLQKDDRLVVIATEDIPAGSSLTAMFTDILWGTKTRRDHLQQARYFSCSCQRCADPTELGSYFSALICPKCKESMLPTKPLISTAPFACTGCKYQITSDELLETNLSLGAETAELLNNPTIEGLETLLEKWLNKVHSHHYHLHAIKHSLLQLYGRANDKEEKNDLYWIEIGKKEKLCQDFLKVCSLLDPSMAHSVPQFGLAFYEMHKSVLEYAKRNFGLAKLNTQQLKKKMQLAKALLRRSMDILENEAEDTPEGQLYSRCEDDFIAIGKWMMAVGLV